MDAKHCRGCHDDFYNQRGPGVGGCWSLKTAKVVTRYRIHFMTAPTELRAFTEVRVPNCYRQPSNNVYCEKLPGFVKIEDVARPRSRTAAAGSRR